jgi:hypothetical protein
LQLTAKDLFSEFLRPFVERDQSMKRTLEFETVYDVLVNHFGSTCSYEEIFSLAIKFGEEETPPDAFKESVSANSFRSLQLRGSLSGAEKVNPSFERWLRGAQGTRSLPTAEKKRIWAMGMAQIDYPLFVERLVETIEQIVEALGGVQLPARAQPWVLREYDFVDYLLSQLEGMETQTRRRTVMALQHALAAADPKQVRVPVRWLDRSLLMWPLSLSLSSFLSRFRVGS